MACVKSDGSITESAKQMLEALRIPRTAEEAATLSGQPLFKVRASLRQMESSGLVVKIDEQYKTTDAGLGKM